MRFLVKNCWWALIDETVHRHASNTNSFSKMFWLKLGIRCNNFLKTPNIMGRELSGYVRRAHDEEYHLNGKVKWPLFSVLTSRNELFLLLTRFLTSTGPLTLCFRIVLDILRFVLNKNIVKETVVFFDSLKISLRLWILSNFWSARSLCGTKRAQTDSANVESKCNVSNVWTFKIPVLENVGTILAELWKNCAVFRSTLP